MAYRNKTYVCFDGDNDMNYYRLLCAWKQNDNSTFNFYNAHEINYARDSSQELSIKRQLKERMVNSKVLVVLVGEKTRYLYKFVRWEIEQAISLEMPIIVVNLNGQRQLDLNRCPPLIREKLAVHISFNSKILQHALENWPNNHKRYSREGNNSAYYYEDEVYSRLGL